MSNLQSQVGTLEGSVDTLTVEVASQKDIAERLKSNLGATKTVLEKSMREYRGELKRQSELVKGQQEFMKVGRNSNILVLHHLHLEILTSRVIGNPFVKTESRPHARFINLLRRPLDCKHCPGRLPTIGNITNNAFPGKETRLYETSKQSRRPRCRDAQDPENRQRIWSP